MYKSKIGIILDSAITSFVLFLLSEIWLRRIIKNANLLLIFSIITSILAFIIIFTFFKNQAHKQKHKLLTNKFINSCIDYLSTTSYNSYNNYIIKLIDCSILDNYLYKLNNSYIYINLQYNITDKDYIEILNKIMSHNHTYNSIYFITKNQLDFIDVLQKEKFKVQPIQPETLIKIMQQKNIYPIENKSQNHTPLFKKFKPYISTKINLTRKQFINLFFTGISLLFISMFIPFSFLYLLTGSLLLLFAILCLFKKNIKPKSKECEFLNLIKKDNC